jgi:hypothetical protein
MTPSPPELFTQRPVRSDFARRPTYRKRRIVTLAVIALLIAGIGYKVFSTHAPRNPEDIPTIKAEAGAWKQKPDQPGGIDIPHQDVQVYQALSESGGDKPPVEHLLPPPETPRPPPILAPATPPTPAVENAAAKKTVDVNDVLAPAPTPPVATTIEAPKPAPIPTVTPAPAVQTEAPTQPLTIESVIQESEKSATTASPANSHSVIQLASVPDEASAQRMLKTLQARYASILGSHHLRLVKADLGAKGIYYRIQSTPVSENEATSMCAALKQQKAGCILVR